MISNTLLSSLSSSRPPSSSHRDPVSLIPHSTRKQQKHSSRSTFTIYSLVVTTVIPFRQNHIAPKTNRDISIDQSSLSTPGLFRRHTRDPILLIQHSTRTQHRNSATIPPTRLNTNQLTTVTSMLNRQPTLPGSSTSTSWHHTTASLSKTPQMSISTVNNGRTSNPTNDTTLGFTNQYPLTPINHSATLENYLPPTNHL